MHFNARLVGEYGKKMTQNYPKILVGCLTYSNKGYILDRFIKRVQEFTYPNFEFLMVDNSKDMDYFNRIKSYGVNVIKVERSNKDTREVICESRNILRQYALDNNFDFFFCLEQDVIPRKDIIEELVQHNLPVVGGWYYINQGLLLKRPCLFKGFIELDVGEEQKQRTLDGYKTDDLELSQNRLVKIYLGSLGVTLIRRDVLEQVKFWWDERFRAHDDSWFFNDLSCRGIDVYVDTDLLCAHFQNSWAIKACKEFIDSFPGFEKVCEKRKEISGILEKKIIARINQLYGEGDK